MVDGDALLEGLPPEKLLTGENRELIWAGIRCIDEIETLRQYVGYENRNRRRSAILRRLGRRRDEIRELSAGD